MPEPMVALPCGSKSTNSTRCPTLAKPAARFTVVVVLPTPPFWFATQKILAIRICPGYLEMANLMPKATRKMPANFSRTRPITGFARMRSAKWWVSKVMPTP